MIQNQNLRTSQSGMVAITVTLILMIVISLIVIGFSTTVRREQRQGLDAQLSSQAFYAAESGVNLAVSKLQADPDLTKDTCEPNPPKITATEYQLEGNDVKITCLLINPNVTAIVHQSLGMNSKVSRISTTNPIDRIYLTWKTGGAANGTGCNGAANFPRRSSWPCDQPVLRVDIVSLGNNPNSLTSTDLKDSQFTAFLKPRAGIPTPSISYASAQATPAPGNLGAVFDASCATECSVNIVPPTGALFGARKNFAIRVMSLYRVSSEVKIQAFHASSADPLGLVGSQAIVDVTAKAQDVLKRVQARVNLNGFGAGYVPDFAIDSRSGICKRYTTNGISADPDPAIPAGTAECNAP
jgi:Tfp pilus assembly protein PilX